MTIEGTVSACSKLTQAGPAPRLCQTRTLSSTASANERARPTHPARTMRLTYHLLRHTEILHSSGQNGFGSDLYTVEDNDQRTTMTSRVISPANSATEPLESRNVTKNRGSAESAPRMAEVFARSISPNTHRTALQYSADCKHRNLVQEANKVRQGIHQPLNGMQSIDHTAAVESLLRLGQYHHSIVQAPQVDDFTPFSGPLLPLTTVDMGSGPLMPDLLIPAAALQKAAFSRVPSMHTSAITCDDLGRI
ncbi:hypothetical protein BCV69DRAFT_201732 [Microstroma glucosiphilum]|uniref:Uncharacterized protein n=1 Tax=Pseudomicrostroma glucosiphilum TaxID=1684307 RepID=A0A316U752_9BASI|nr:hypothetical protein BCV69DRAFT_201732 [Pseudomicrostroma glucosiphilum]PWN20183.1 hypothetical protein BCV69DRAFT_201732 [Pseudomicrostroma glucosiphilum]